MWPHPEAHPGAYLEGRFLRPLGLSASDLARGCGFPRSRVSEILSGKRAITADTATRLASFFRMRPEFWMSLQASWDLQRVPPVAGVNPLDPPGFLVGPDGATPIPRRPQPGPRYVQVPAREAPAPEPEGEAVHEEVRYPDGTRALVSRRR